MITDDAADALAQGGYSAAYGVRALRRFLDAELLTPLAQMMATLGADAKNTLVWCGVGDEACDQPERQRIAAQRTLTGLQLCAYRQSAATRRKHLKGAKLASAVRREADSLMALEQAVQVGERLALVRSQLALAKDNAAAARDIAALQREHHRLASAWEQAEKLREDIAAAEQLSLTALLENDDPKPWAVEAEQLLASFREALFAVLVSEQAKRHDVTLRLVSRGESGLLERWLASLLPAAKRRSWQLWAHAWAATDKLRTPTRNPSWPAHRSWTEPRDCNWLEREVIAKAGHHKMLLLRVQGRDAAVALGLEQGLHAEQPKKPGANRRFLQIDMMALRSELSDLDWQHRELVERPATHAPQRRNTARFRREGQPLLHVHDRELRIAASDYWTRHARVGLEVLLWHHERELQDQLYAEKLVAAFGDEGTPEGDP